MLVGLSREDFDSAAADASYTYKGHCSEDNDLQGLPTFATAVRSRVIIGPTTYAIEANPKYAVAFRKTTSDRLADYQKLAKVSAMLTYRPSARY